jgi:hypothetical protein
MVAVWFLVGKKTAEANVQEAQAAARVPRSWTSIGSREARASRQWTCVRNMFSSAKHTHNVYSDALRRAEAFGAFPASYKTPKPCATLK